MQSEPVAAPVAKISPVTHTLHGDTRVDHYAWLREKDSEETLAYLRAENAHADAHMAGTDDFQKALYDEMLGRIVETDLSVPYRLGTHFYYTRTVEGKQYPIYCRAPQNGESVAPAADTEGKLPGEVVLLDVNALAENEKFMSIGAFSVSDDENVLAYSTDNTGFREYTLAVKNLRTGELLPDRIEKVGGVAWAADNVTLYYTTEDAAKRPFQVFRHALGAEIATDTLIYEEPDALYRAFLYRSRDKKLLFVGSLSSTTTEMHFLPSEEPAAPLSLVLPREENHEYYAEHRDGLLYLRTNKDAVNFKLVVTPIDDASPMNWTDVIASNPAVMVEDFDVFANHLVASLRVDGLEALRVLSFESGETHEITFPEPTYMASADVNRQFDTTKFRFRYTSLVTPMSVFEYDLNSRERTLLKQTPVKGGYDADQYVAERLFATARDGTKIPISLVRRRDTPVDSSAPCLLYGYGSYGIVMPPFFNSNRLSLLNRGVIYAIAHIRGGGEYGKPWHDSGKMMVKTNTFTDFIDSADFLVENRYATREKLAIMGGSAGGLLMGAVVNMRPDVASICVSYVPFVDVMNTMLDDTLPLTVGEYLEWGNPNEPDAYFYMKSYSPYDNLEAKAYPTILMRTSLNDSQVMYWEPAKYVAKLRTLKTDTNPLLLKTNMEAGHGGASGRYDALKESAFDYAFLLKQWGIDA